jgi:hypothetical protein
MRMAERLMQHNIDVADPEASTGRKAEYNWRSITVAVEKKSFRFVAADVTASAGRRQIR